MGYECGIYNVYIYYIYICIYICNIMIYIYIYTYIYIRIYNMVSWDIFMGMGYTWVVHTFYGLFWPLDI